MRRCMTVYCIFMSNVMHHPDKVWEGGTVSAFRIDIDFFFHTVLNTINNNNNKNHRKIKH